MWTIIENPKKNTQKGSRLCMKQNMHNKFEKHVHETEDAQHALIKL